MYAVLVCIYAAFVKRSDHASVAKRALCKTFIIIIIIIIISQ